MSLLDDRDTDAEQFATEPFEATWAWKAGAAAGLVATAAMGAVITAMDISTLQQAISGLYGFSGGFVAGWVVHLIHGTLFGLLFALVLSDPGLYNLTDWYWKTLVAGVVYGMMLAVFGAGIIMPIWLTMAGFPSPPPIPNVTVPMILWHLVYGIVLGGLYPLLVNR